jgi:hypothetical protein
MSEYTNVVINGLSHDDGAENPGGVAEVAYLLRYSEILALQEPTISTTPASVLTISATHTMKTGKSPVVCEPVYEKSDFESALEGEVYSKMFNPKLTLFMAQPSVDNAGGFSTLKNARLVVLFKRPGQAANYYQMGGKFLAAKINEGSVKFGKGPTGEAGVTFTVEAHNPQPFFYYTGTLPVTGA